VCFHDPSSYLNFKKYFSFNIQVFDQPTWAALFARWVISYFFKRRNQHEKSCYVVIIKNLFLSVQGWKVGISIFYPHRSVAATLFSANYRIWKFTLQQRYIKASTNFFHGVIHGHFFNLWCFMCDICWSIFLLRKGRLTTWDLFSLHCHYSCYLSGDCGGSLDLTQNSCVAVWWNPVDFTTEP
jgi:hypothetical protein